MTRLTFPVFFGLLGLVSCVATPSTRFVGNWNPPPDAEYPFQVQLLADGTIIWSLPGVETVTGTWRPRANQAMTFTLQDPYTEGSDPAQRGKLISDDELLLGSGRLTMTFSRTHE